MPWVGMKSDLCRLAAVAALLIGTIAHPHPAQAGVSFDGVSQYVTFGRAPHLGTAAFTLETWFNWTGEGVAANTGVGGVMVLPLVTKLSAEKDGDARDGNYLLGLRPADGVLVADLEEGESGAAPGRNHPVFGVTMVTTNVWHHAAVTYDGTNCQLFLDGHLETTVFVGQPPRWDSLQHAALATSLTSTGAPQGFFAGALEDVRIWDHARSASQIASNRYRSIAAAPGLLGRWALDETNGPVAHDTSGHAAHGALVNGPLWSRSDQAPADVVTPVKLVAIDPSRTAALRQAEARRVPAIFRFDATVAGLVETNFHLSYLLTREQFWRRSRRRFPGGLRTRRCGPTPGSTGSWPPSAAGTRTSPSAPTWPGTWTLGQSDRTLQREWAGRLREAMTHRSGRRPARRGEARASAGAPHHAQLLQRRPGSRHGRKAGPDASPDEPRHPQSGPRRAPAQFPTNELAVARYLAGFLRENRVFDDALTGRSRARRTEALFAADHYEPGELLVRRGQLIDTRARAALDELKARTGTDGPTARSPAERLGPRPRCDSSASRRPWPNSSPTTSARRTGGCWRGCCSSR